MAAERVVSIDQGPSMSDKEFRLLSELVYAECGIKLEPGKKIMLAGRLSKRLRALGLSSFREYHDYVTSPEGRVSELGNMIDRVSTNKTDFFRERHHFDILVNETLPSLVGPDGPCRDGHLNVWSAACSTGEEPYTLAMVLTEARTKWPRLNASVMATDINREVLQHAIRAVYSKSVVQPVPAHMRTRYLLKGKGEKDGYYRVVPELRKMVTFRHTNLISGDYPFSCTMDVVFCRNVIIYFDRPTQTELFRRIYAKMSPGAYLFLGHAESLQGIEHKFEWTAPTIYRKPAGTERS